MGSKTPFPRVIRPMPAGDFGPMTEVKPGTALFYYNLSVPAEEPGENPGLPRNGDVRKD